MFSQCSLPHEINKAEEMVGLAFEDDLITEEDKSEVGYWTDKVGGCPDWPVDGISTPNCQLCGLVQLLVVQIHARDMIFYVFCCINPNCWNHSESWSCLRCQYPNSNYDVPSPVVNKAATDWCAGADDWDDDNGNTKPTNQFNQSDYESDDESSSLSAGIGNLNVDEFNANYGNLEKSSGAVGKLLPPVATAEIEKEENEVVSIDTPTTPQNDLLALLQEAAPVPFNLRSGDRNQSNFSFESFFISWGWEPERNVSFNSDHIKKLLLQYQRNHGEVFHQGYSQDEKKGEGSSEEYEKAMPAHGDKMYHNFISRIQCNPGQLIRYYLETGRPFLLYPLQEPPKTCKYCNGDIFCLMQLLPTLISKLKFPGENKTRVEFGTVLIFICKQRCWSPEDKVRQEQVIVQVEKT